MEIKLNRSEFITKIDVLKKVIDKKGETELSNIYLEYENGEVKLIAGNKKEWIVTYIQASVKGEDGYILIPVDKVEKAVKLWKDDELTIENKGDIPSLVCGKKYFTFNNKQDVKLFVKFYKEMLSYSGDFSLELTHNRFVSHIKKNMASLDKDKKHEQLANMNLSCQEGEWQLVSTDSHLLQYGVVGNGGRFTYNYFNLSETLCNIIAAIKPNDENKIYIQTSSEGMNIESKPFKRYLIVAGDFVIFAENETRFPAWRKVIPSAKNINKYAEFKKNDILDFINESKIVDGEQINFCSVPFFKNNPVKDFNVNVWNDELDRYEDSIHADTNFKGKFSFRINMLNNLIKNFDEDKIRFEFIDNTRPFIIRENDRLGLIMPCI